MSTIDPEASDKIDLYLSKFDDEILEFCIELRELIHACDYPMDEDFKWGRPVFHHKGLACSIGAFRKHVHLFLFNGQIIEDKYGLYDRKTKENSQARSIKIMSQKDFVPDVLLYYINESARMNAEGIKPQKADREKLQIPESLQTVFKKYPVAEENFKDFSYSRQKEYIEWINSSKKEATTERRIEKAIDLILAGKGLHDKYKK